jgi:predicted transcriptional regulator YdeE
MNPGRDMQRPKDEKDAITRSDQPGFTLIGIAIRTNNAKEATPDGVIPKQWQKLFGEGLLGKIPKQTESVLYAVYTDYATDHTGDYTHIIGLPVREGTPPPSGMVVTHVPAGQYAKFTTGQGPFAKIVPAAWQHILKLEEQGKLKRAYRADFEVYDQRSQDPENAQIDIWVGLR